MSAVASRAWLARLGRVTRERGRAGDESSMDAKIEDLNLVNALTRVSSDGDTSRA